MASMHAGAQPGTMLAFNLPMSRACATECVTALKKLGGHLWAAYLTVGGQLQRRKLWTGRRSLVRILHPSSWGRGCWGEAGKSGGGQRRNGVVLVQHAPVSRATCKAIRAIREARRQAHSAAQQRSAATWSAHRACRCSSARRMSLQLRQENIDDRTQCGSSHAAARRRCACAARPLCRYGCGRRVANVCNVQAHLGRAALLACV